MDEIINTLSRLNPWMVILVAGVVAAGFALAVICDALLDHYRNTKRLRQMQKRQKSL